MTAPDPIDEAIAQLWLHRSFRHGGHTLTVACLLRAADQRPLQASWWKGKEAYLIGADLDGNFFLRHCDGTVRHWDHRAQADTLIARSVRDFVMRLE